MKQDLQQLRVKCPLPVLMARLGLERYAKSSCLSPFRPDQKASWGIFETNGRWMFKDFATGESGDEITLLAHVNQLDQKRDFIKLLDLYATLANSATVTPISSQDTKSDINAKPDTAFLNTGTDQQLKKLSELRNISVEGLFYASQQNVLKFGDWHGHEVFAVVDQSGYLAELRRLDGNMFDAYGFLEPHKSHTLKHSRKNWPLGVLEARDCPVIALVEGMPDFLAMHQFVVEENMIGKVAPVAMLSGSCEIASDALQYFSGKTIRIFPHADVPGIEAAERWHKQLIRGGSVDFFNFRAFEVAAGSCIKDLCDFNQLRGVAGIQQQLLKTL